MVGSGGGAIAVDSAEVASGGGAISSGGGAIASGGGAIASGGGAIASGGAAIVIGTVESHTTEGNSGSGGASIAVAWPYPTCFK